MIDTHAHLYDHQFDGDIDDVILRAEQSGVQTIVVPATKPSEFALAEELAARHPRVIRIAIGVHPHHASEVGWADLELVERLLEDSEYAVAVGEIGLDYHYDFSPAETQKSIFREQLRIAKRRRLPAVIHTRKSDDDVLDMLELEQDGTLEFQMHCFSGDVQSLNRAVALGAMISFTGNVTFKKSTLDEVVSEVPLDRLMLETDSPYMSPVPHRGKRNEPAYVSLVAERVAAIRGQSPETIMLATTNNARRFFRLAALIFLMFMLPVVGHVAAQTGGVTPSSPVDTVGRPRPAFEKWLGIGGHIASSTYISESETIANGVFGTGFWLSFGPLESLNIDWVRLDIVYTSVTNSTAPDSVYEANHNGALATNSHGTLDIKARFIANPRSVINFFGSFGVTMFNNEFGALKYRDDNANVYGATPYSESLWGIGGSVGISASINTAYGTIAPTAEWQVSTMSGERVTNFKGQEFVVSQQRVGILFYPNFGAIFGSK